ncbi:predicted protein [Plenodomus lingam JN3]|uniref:Predicted protein n=1 Tax=Leptosphaeria maculans (strain JN3 / isolate v23.1.3 / race Av1-4-5-6-7-8) TaxID=985895 RepID=E4ZHG7_LEPMJ|nr:predicted protein [Plenodomus lingam JN3]CBX90800.1 predicted protein [Plenodomus lingam JN3]
MSAFVLIFSNDRFVRSLALGATAKQKGSDAKVNPMMQLANNCDPPILTSDSRASPLTEEVIASHYLSQS